MMMVDAMRVRHCCSAIVAMLGGILLSTAAAHTKLSEPDWKALHFTCTKEQNPKFDGVSESWFQRAKGLDSQQDEAKDAEMVRLYQQASERGHYKAMLNLAGLYVRGIGVDRNERKAVDLVERALNLGSPHAYYLMGVMLQQGVGVRQDKAAALSYFRRSADLGNKYGQFASGQSLRNAFADEPAPNKQRGYAIAVRMLECSLSQDHAEAGYLLGRHYLSFENNPERALFYLQRAAALGHGTSIYKLKHLFKSGENGVAKSPEKAACYDRVRDLLRKEPSRKFPDIDRLCPLPPPSATTGAGGQSSPRVGLWHQAGNPTVMFRAAAGDSLPLVDGAPVQWEWEASPFEGTRIASGQSCPWPGTWACEDLPIGSREFAHGETFPEVDGRPVTWRLVPLA